MSLKLAPVSAVLLSQFVKSEAGAVEAQYDMRLCAVYGAYLCALKDGNKTQLMMVEANAKTYNTPKACRELTNTPDRTTPAATKASKVYQAYGFAIAECGIPSLLKIDGKKAPLEACQLEAEALAVAFVDVVTAALMPEVKAPKTEAEKEADKAAKAAKELEKAQKAAEADTAMLALIEEKASEKAASMAVPALDVADMAKSVELAITLGTLDDSSMEALYSAIQARMLVAAQARTEVPAFEEMPA